MSYASIDDLRSQLDRPAVKESSAPDSLRGGTAAYAAKMLHPLPDGKEVDRAAFILERVKGKRVLEFGATGPMHDAVVKVAASVWGFDREDNLEVEPPVVGFDMDDVSITDIPVRDGFDLVLCGEVIEHLSNPGWFLTRLRRQYPGLSVLITVPNAFSVAGSKWLLKGIESVNRDHVAYYSWKTLSVLLERAGYEVTELAWYNGKPGFAEGLIVVAHTKESV